ncbi:MAG: ABC transporter ATP-binding protein [Spirochaetales bacterium]
MTEFGLVTNGLSCGYERSNPVLKSLQISFRESTFSCVIGSNGVGKTTLLRTLAGILSPLEGTATLGGVPVHELTPIARARRMSVVLTELVPPGYLTVSQFVQLGRHPHQDLFGRLRKEDHAACERALEQAGISHLRERWLSEVSDGERQRAAIARGLAQSAEVMILDEPTAFLDAAGRATIMTRLQRIAHESRRLIVATSHDIDLVLRTADTVVLLRDDGHVCVGSPEDLVIAGELERLFPASELQFDHATGSFRLPPRDGPLVCVTGNSTASCWARHVVERIGFTVCDGPPYLLRVTPDDHTPTRFTLCLRDNEDELQVANSYAELAAILRFSVGSMHGTHPGRG